MLKDDSFERTFSIYINCGGVKGTTHEESGDGAGHVWPVVSSRISELVSKLSLGFFIYGVRGLDKTISEVLIRLTVLVGNSEVSQEIIAM